MQVFMGFDVHKKISAYFGFGRLLEIELDALTASF